MSEDKLNLDYINPPLREQIENATEIGEISVSKSGHKILRIDGINFHSIYDPIKEAERLSGEFKTEEEKLFIFFGAGLGYSILEMLENEKYRGIWIECHPGIFRQALQCNDFQKLINANRLTLILYPILEDEFLSIVKGTGGMPIRFIFHRPSFLWKKTEYEDVKFTCEKLFHKKDVNMATLSRFEKIWTRNFLKNIPKILNMRPVANLFGSAKGLPIVVCGAGPSLAGALSRIKKYRNEFLLIAVDTAVNVLKNDGIDPDIIYTVDPQPVNTEYLESYIGNAILVFDPTSCYLTTRLEVFKNKTFITSSPFPMIKIITNGMSEELGEVPFGGSVSTNAVSLATLMGADKVYLLGQDLAFTGNLAHCKGAILEEKLKYKETRKFRSELHNFRQLYALPRKSVLGIDGVYHITNDKMLIFKKWFEENRNPNWINLGEGGALLEGIPGSTLEKEFITSKNTDLILNWRTKILNENAMHNLKDESVLIDDFKNTSKELKNFENLLLRGFELSSKIYTLVKLKKKSNELTRLLKEIETIDDEVSSKKGLNEIIGISMQRTILMITEGYDSDLTNEEKADPHLATSKKSILLYNGLLESSRLIRLAIKRALLILSGKTSF